MPWNCEQSFVKFGKELITISSHYIIVAFLEKICEYWNHGKKRGCFTCKLCWHVKVYVYVHFTSVCQVDMLKSHGHGQLFLVRTLSIPDPSPHQMPGMHSHDIAVYDGAPNTLKLSLIESYSPSSEQLLCSYHLSLN